jgi:hypothetical protein
MPGTAIFVETGCFPYSFTKYKAENVLQKACMFLSVEIL